MVPQPDRAEASTGDVELRLELDASPEEGHSAPEGQIAPLRPNGPSGRVDTADNLCDPKATVLFLLGVPARLPSRSSATA